MPWKECSVIDERLQFVAWGLAGEPMAELCREFGISRKTGHKIFERYQACRVQELTDRSRRPYRYANQLPFQWRTTSSTSSASIAAGARARLESAWHGDSLVSNSRRKHIHAVLDRHGLVERRGRAGPLLPSSEPREHLKIIRRAIRCFS
jgi:putative transposase